MSGIFAALSRLFMMMAELKESMPWSDWEPVTTTVVVLGTTIKGMTGIWEPYYREVGALATWWGSIRCLTTGYAEVHGSNDPYLFFDFGSALLNSIWHDYIA